MTDQTILPPPIAATGNSPLKRGQRPPADGEVAVRIAVRDLQHRHAASSTAIWTPASTLNGHRA